MATCVNNIETALVSNLPLSIFAAQEPMKNKIIRAAQLVCPQEVCKVDGLIRAIVCRYYREKGNVDAVDIPMLLMMALKTITIATLDAPVSAICIQLAKENETPNLVDLGTAVISQMMTHLPKDISEFISADIRLAVFKLFIQNLPLKEKFDMLPTDLVNAASSTDITLDKTLYDVLSPAIKEERQKTKVVLPQDMDHIQFVEADLTPLQTQPSITLPNDMATNIEVNPNIMVGADATTGKVQYYYYDKLSGTLSDIPVNGDSIPIQRDQLDDALLHSNMSTDSITDVLDKIASSRKPAGQPSSPTYMNTRTTSSNLNIPTMDNTSTITTTQTPSDITPANLPINISTSSKSSSQDYTWVIIGSVLVIILVIAVIIGIVMYTRANSKSA